LLLPTFSRNQTGDAEPKIAAATHPSLGKGGGGSFLRTITNNYGTNIWHNQVQKHWPTRWVVHGVYVNLLLARQKFNLYHRISVKHANSVREVYLSGMHHIKTCFRSGELRGMYYFCTKHPQNYRENLKQYCSTHSYQKQVTLINSWLLWPHSQN